MQGIETQEEQVKVRVIFLPLVSAPLSKQTAVKYETQKGSFLLGTLAYWIDAPTLNGTQP